MLYINATGLEGTALNRTIRSRREDCKIGCCLGQRFIGAGLDRGNLVIEGVPGNALGAYLNGASIEVSGNAQDAVGDTMNSGSIVIHGSIGDAAGYAMRGGTIYVRDNAGYRAGVHMKAYEERLPVLVIGGRAGSFLGEYQAGGIILVLGLHTDGKPITGNFPCTGMHGGKVFFRSDCKGVRFPGQVTAKAASSQDLLEISPYLETYCRLFGGSMDTLLSSPYTIVTPDSSNPYHQLYVAN